MESLSQNHPLRSEPRTFKPQGRAVNTDKVATKFLIGGHKGTVGRSSRVSRSDPCQVTISITLGSRATRPFLEDQR